MQGARVSVICLCYNHARFVGEAIDSVLQQTYDNVELIVVDDASQDDSVAVIREKLRSLPEARFIPLQENTGNCRAFNQGLAHATGDYIIDLAADDVLLPGRVAEGVKALQTHGVTYGLSFTDAEWIDDAGNLLHLHSQRFPHDKVQQGDVYLPLITRYFICSPSMMFTRLLIDSLGGYDESLSYEDFDLWMRGARAFRFCYTPQVLVRKRVVRGSLAKKQFTRKDRQRYSTYRVCEKILEMNRTRAEQRALHQRIGYEMKQCLKVLDVGLLLRYVALRRKNRRQHYPG
ncbi:glycosyltransferase [Dawidia soli]|uniref:Glycosyltransferase n=1 Tax=Dawidia soli TaxID=2782352 RepID=A0AAP2GM37_9BACT|nr:glycosyltransferase [Dawidia soli]MBT1690848.1 glycosyltransferase [Dawidia soli]